jgi:hypothetical protein
MDIPTKNLKRWMTYGVFRKSGAGRKRIDPEMEEKLFNWIRETYTEGDYIDQTILRSQALNFSSKPEFKASKGWLSKFTKRF